MEFILRVDKLTCGQILMPNISAHLTIYTSENLNESLNIEFFTQSSSIVLLKY